MDESVLLSAISRIYDDYFKDVKRMMAELEPGDGLLGCGRGPGSAPCHDRFSERLRQVLEVVALGTPSTATTLTLLRFMYEQPAEHRNDSLVYWMLLAVHGLTDGLIGFLSPEDAAGLAAQYEETFPRYERMPAQERVLKLLRERAGPGAPQKKKGLFGFFNGNGGKTPE